MRRGRLGFWLRFAVCVLKPALTLMTRRDWRGREHVPPTGGVILAANHVSYADPFTMAHFVYDAGRLPRFLAKESLFALPFAGTVLRGAGQIPVRRGAADASAALAAARAALERGECVVIYPEGTVTRDPDRWPMLARTGVARLALETGVAVVPVAQWGPQEIWDRYAGHLSLRPRRQVHYRAGAPVDLSSYEGRPLTAALLREATDTIMRAVRDELGVVRGEVPPDRFLEPPQRTDRTPLRRRSA